MTKRPAILLAVLACTSALAQNAPVRVAQAAAPDPSARCRKDVKDYVDTLRFVRQSAGDTIGNKVATGFMSEAEVDKLVAAQGHCAAAQVLRDRGAPLR